MGVISRLGRLLRGFLALFIGGLEERNPEALLEAAKGDFREKMAEYNRALARLAGIAERLKSQIKIKTDRVRELEKRVMANHKVGNLELAGSLARELQEIKSDVENDAQELKGTEEAYESNMNNAKIVQKEFEDKVKRLQRQLNQVKLKEAQAEASSALGGVAFKVGDTGDTLKNLEEILGTKHEKAAGQARVVKDLGEAARYQEREAEQKAMEQVALAEFLAERGIAADAGSDGSVAKEIGPREKATETE